MKRKSLKQFKRDDLLKIREEVILDIVDPEMVPIVDELRKAGLKTFTCCQSGPGHSFHKPTIRFSIKHTKNQVYGTLKKLDYGGFELTKVYDIHGEPRYWQVEFYVNVPKKGIHLTHGTWHSPTEVTHLKKQLYYLLYHTEQDTGINDE